MNTNNLNSATQYQALAKIIDTAGKPTLVAARLYFDHVAQTYHSGSHPTVGLTGNRNRQLSILQSEWMRFPFHISRFTTVEGVPLTPDAVSESLAKPVALLLLPEGAALHPAIKSTLRSDAILVSRVRDESLRELVKRPQSR